MALRGAVSAEDLKGITAARAELLSDAPFVLALVDARELGAIPVETRKLAARTIPLVTYRGIALFGASFQTRILAKLVLGAARLLGREERNPVQFFDTEAEARAWLTERAAELKGLK